MVESVWRQAPILRKLAIRILGKTSSSSGCERNWSIFERVHTKRRNRLEHQRLNDLVYVAYNLHLQNKYNFSYVKSQCFLLIIYYKLESLNLKLYFIVGGNLRRFIMISLITIFYFIR
jgi:hypothetical protein